MQHKFFLCMALVCLAAIPALQARTLDGAENELMEMAIQALEHGRALTAEESMVMQSGTYGAGAMVGGYGSGSAGGILDDASSTPAPSSSGLEAGSSNSPASSTISTPAPAAATTATKSAASTAQQSAALLAAGVLAAALLL